MTGLDWDDPLPLNISKKVTNWLRGLETLKSFQSVKMQISKLCPLKCKHLERADKQEFIKEGRNDYKET